jgi:flavin reductase (DIM6/NTAB) family NADH-FMN oxidoreductase RutF
MDPKLAEALAEITTGIYVLTVREGDKLHAGDHTLFVASVVRAEIREQDSPITSHDLPYIYVGTVIPRQRN